LSPVVLCSLSVLPAVPLSASEYFGCASPDCFRIARFYTDIFAVKFAANILAMLTEIFKQNCGKLQIKQQYFWQCMRKSKWQNFIF
jgi:hypothetical protein